jgi:hypothetical protein
VPSGAQAALGSAFTNCVASASGSSQTVTITLADSGGTCSLPASTATSVTIADITNPSAGSTTESVKTSVDTSAVNGITWDGRWGGSGSLLGVLGPGNSPASPGASSDGRYACTQAGWACATTPDGSPVPLAYRRSLAAIRPPQSRCSAWFDTGLAAFACSPSQLANAVQHFTLPHRGRFTLLVAKHRTGTAPGLVQVVGSPLRIGDTVRLVGKPARDEIVILNCLVGAKEYLIHLSRIRVKTGATAKITLVTGRVRPVLRRVTARVTVTRVVPKTSGG